MPDNDPTTRLPEAVVRPMRRPSAYWLIPIAAALLAGWLGYQAWLRRGTVIMVQLEQGYGLQPGADVRYRGIVVGQIRKIELSKDLDGIVVTAALHSRAGELARGGARFWVVRPQLGPGGVAGLETLVGPRYLAVLPGDGPTQREFIGLGEPPIIDAIDARDLEIVLQAQRRGSLRPGAPILYRQIPVGTILSVGLTGDSGAVEARACIQRPYAQLVRPETRFWNVSGFAAQVGLKGVALEVESGDALLAGGVALATPPGAGEVVRNGHRFTIESEPKDEWLAWQPLVAVGSSLLPPNAVLPKPLRAVIGWKQGRWLKSERSRRGWVLPTEEGLLGPLDLLRPGEKAQQDTVVLEVAGRVIPLTSEPKHMQGGLAVLDFSADVGAPGSPTFVPQRTAHEPEDCLAIADPAATPLPLAAAHLTFKDGSWLIDRSIPLDENWHGAAVVARSDGKLVGILLVEGHAGRVALLGS
ncbi:MAG TPA: MlaD family protein [Phycisphaerae bacterium]